MVDRSGINIEMMINRILFMIAFTRRFKVHGSGLREKTSTDPLIASNFNTFSSSRIDH